jgi:hypothetical protein
VTWLPAKRYPNSGKIPIIENTRAPRARLVPYRMEPMSDEHHLVVVHAFATEMEAVIAKSALESSGIIVSSPEP